MVDAQGVLDDFQFRLLVTGDFTQPAVVDGMVDSFRHTWNFTEERHRNL